MEDDNSEVIIYLSGCTKVHSTYTRIKIKQIQFLIELLQQKFLISFSFLLGTHFIYFLLKFNFNLIILCKQHNLMKFKFK